MKYLPIFLILSILASSCNRAASFASPTEPPLNFPSPAPENTETCQQANLHTSSNSSTDSGMVTLGVTITNASKNNCTVVSPVQVNLLNTNRLALSLQSIEMPALQTQPASALKILTPGEITIVSLIWRNYCLPMTTDQIIIQLEISREQILEVPITLPATPACDDKNQPSTLTIIPYSAPP